MTLKSKMDADVSAVFLNTDHHAESVTREIAGDSGDTETVTAIVEQDEPEEDDQRGRSILRRSTLHIDADQSTDEDDSWLIDGKRYETRTIGEAVAGLVEVRVVRREAKETTHSGRSRPRTI